MGKTMKPNKYGCYDKADAECIQFETKTSPGWCSPKAECDIHILQIGSNKWIASCSFNFTCGDFSGMHSPLTEYPKCLFASRDEALKSKLSYLIDHFQAKLNRGLDRSCVSQVQLDECQKLLDQLNEYAGAPAANGQLSMFGALA